jgi:acyl-CoA synthetase (AMP-forming)/AMP-acid ligase II
MLVWGIQARVPLELELMTQELVEHPRHHAGADPERLALVIADTGESVSYGQLMQGSARSARLLEALGCAQGDTICLLSKNNPTFLEICWGAKDSGLHYACVSTQLNADDAAYIVANSDARVFIASYTMAELAGQIAAKLAGNVRLLMFGGTIDGFESYEAYRDQQSDQALPDRIRGASMLYSSGTTGRPKGVRTALLDVPPTVPPLRHRLIADFFGFDSTTVFINPGPFYHAAPLRMMMAVQRLGGTAVGFSHFDPETVLEGIQRYRGTHGFFVPTMFVRMLQLEEPLRQKFDLSSMRCAIHGAAPCFVPVKEAMMAWWGPVLYEVYGGTEGVGHTFIGPQEWLRKKGSVGKAASGCTIRIVDEQNREVPANTPGLVYLGNGRQFEYYKDEEKTAQAMDAEGLATMGDIGYLDDDGYLFLTDRQAHMIISGGVNIYPQEAEAVLIEHPGIEDVAVIGVPNPEFGEEVKAVVVPARADCDPDILAAEIIRYCRKRLSAIKCPRTVDFVSELPRSDAGKLLKRLIRAPYWEGRDSAIV